jgi:hypothetical protein
VLTPAAGRCIDLDDELGRIWLKPLWRITGSASAVPAAGRRTGSTSSRSRPGRDQIITIAA